jgi:hypothetical protein
MKKACASRLLFYAAGRSGGAGLSPIHGEVDFAPRPIFPRWVS